MSPAPQDAMRAGNAVAPSPLALARLAPFGLAVLQFGLVILVIRVFGIESRAFLHLAVLAWAGFVVHHFLPARLRLPFFGLLSGAGIVLVLGPANGAWLVATGLVLIGAIHLPVAFAARVGVVVALAAALWLLRAGIVEGPVPDVIWPILGSMFMFRMIVYAYDLRHAAAPVSFWRAIAYFFLLPNVCFPLFPVVDYSTFCRTYHAEDEALAYQRGVTWMLRGCVHLLLYRLIYQNLMLDPAAISSGAEAVQLVLATYLLYLKVSGSFHLIVGMLRMFGFHLPETNHNWLISASFTDFWRRINIYWKDFILKILFNPLYLPLRRRWGDARAITVAATVVFIATWLLHSYQWFWIRGSFPLTWQDGVFWMFLGALVCLNMVWEVRRGRRRTLKPVRRSARAEVLLALRTVGTFCVICLSWSLWSAESAAELRLTWSRLGLLTAAETGAVLLALAVLGGVAVGLSRSSLEQPEVLRRRQAAADPTWLWRQAATVCVLSVTLVVLGARPTVLAFEPRLAGLVDQLRRNQLNTVDARRLERGYYEDLADATRFNDELGLLYAGRPRDWIGDTAGARDTGGFPRYEMVPSTRTKVKGVFHGINRFGMRDREYEQAKPAGTYRIVLLGDSHAMGSGVEDRETFENLVEDRLNAGAEGRRVEILNFAVAGHGPLSRLAVLERVFAFEPDAVLYEGIDDFTWLLEEASNAIEEGREIPFEHVVAALAAAGVEPGLPEVVTRQRLGPKAREVVAWIYQEIATRCRARGVRPLATFLPRPEGRPEEAALIASQAELASQAGFEVLDVSAAYAGTPDLSTLWLAAWDKHPNAAGHRLLADHLYLALRAWLDGGSPGSHERADQVRR